MKLSQLLTAVLLTTIAHLQALNKDFDLSQSLHIDELMPREGLFSTIAIEPGIPKDYVAMCKDGEISYCNWVYWGPKKELEAYFKDPLSLSKPIIRVKFASGISQTQFGRFDEELIKDDRAKLNGFVIDFGKWGTYPYLTMTNPSDAKLNSAFVGLNSESGVVLYFNLIVPEKSKSDDDALKFWNKFIQETTQLPEHLFYKVNGQEMYTGYTIVNIAGHKVKMIAEQRKSDKKILFAAFPEGNQNIKFEFDGASVGLKGGEWRCNDPLLKISGMYVIDDGYISLTMTTSVFIKDVDDFSLNKKTKGCIFQKTVGEPTQVGIFPPKDGKLNPLVGKIIDGRYYSSEGIFSCKAYDFGENKLLSQDHHVELSHGSYNVVGFYNSKGNFKKAEVVVVADDMKHSDEKALKKAFNHFGTGTLKLIDNAQGIEILKEEMITDKILFVAISVEKMLALNIHSPCAMGYLVFQEENKLVLLSNKEIKIPQKMKINDMIENLKKDLLEFKDTFVL